MTDSQRKDMVGCYGNKAMKTPNLDNLAEIGMRFNKAYTTQPVCGPARSAIFTGTYPHTNGSWGNGMALGDNVKTIGQRLRDNGFETAYIGKWHLDGGDYFGLGRCPDGWNSEYWYDMRCYLEELTEEDRVWSRKPQIMEQRKITEEFTYSHRCSDRAIDFLSKNKDEDFLLVVSYDEPHDPYVCPEPYSSMYRDYEFPKNINLWDNLEDKPEHHRAWAGDNLYSDKDSLKIKQQYFFGCNSYVDYEIGRVLNTIYESTPDALIIYTSDHGDMLNSHSLTGKGAAMYEEITNIPFIVRWPGITPEGFVCHSPVSHIDITPTILEAAGLSVAKLLEGKSLKSTLCDPAVKTNDAVFMEFSRYEVDHDGFGGFQPVRAIFDGRYKLVINLLTSDELYDIEKDPSEMKNIIKDAEYGDVLDKLHDMLLAWMNNTRDPFRGYYWEQRPWKKDASSATWSYTGMTRQRENEEYEPKQLDYSTGLEITEAVRRK
ncbi:sulfatase-like hydrolase/transferase [Clostridium swellfunianum]|nr:sulfatase-like hydrolase/transferase [Clostridium swellfunianum]